MVSPNGMVCPWVSKYIMKIIVTLKWVEALNRWDIIKENGFTMYDIPACENVDMIFDHPRKDVNEKFVIDISRVQTGE